MGGWTIHRRRHAHTEQGPSFPSHQATMGCLFYSRPDQTQHFSLARCWTELLVNDCVDSSPHQSYHSACVKGVAPPTKINNTLPPATNGQLLCLPPAISI